MEFNIHKTDRGLVAVNDEIPDDANFVLYTKAIFKLSSKNLYEIDTNKWACMPNQLAKELPYQKVIATDNTFLLEGCYQFYPPDDKEEKAKTVISEMGYRWEETEASVRSVVRFLASKGMYSEEDMLEFSNWINVMDIEKEMGGGLYYFNNDRLTQKALFEKFNSLNKPKELIAIDVEEEIIQTTKKEEYKYFGNHDSNLNYIARPKIINNFLQIKEYIFNQ